MIISIRQEPFDPWFELSAIKRSRGDLSGKYGACASFVGTMRDFNEGDDVHGMELEHYPGMTERLCEEILDEANQRFPFDGATVLHRVGKLSAGEQIVMVAISSRHRENAFQAAQFVMDYLKTRATFWKKEVGSKGAEWLGVKEKDRLAADQWGELND